MSSWRAEGQIYEQQKTEDVLAPHAAVGMRQLDM